MLGFTHNWNVGIWNSYPTAQSFTNGAITAGLNVPALSKIVATQWNSQIGSQWYNSYVVTTTFPGMPTHNWNWRSVPFSNMPGNGIWIWVSAPVTVTFNVNQ